MGSSPIAGTKKAAPAAAFSISAATGLDRERPPSEGEGGGREGGP